MCSLQIPDEVLQEAGMTGDDALLELALRLFETGRLSLPSAARLARLDRSAMEDALLAHRIPVYKPAVEDFINDLDALQRSTD